MSDSHQPESRPVEDDGPPGLPLWVKAAALVVALLLAVYLVLLLTGHGGHGPGMHFSSEESSTGEAAALPAGR